MKIKAGNDAWKSAEPTRPIAICLSAKDRENIANMAPGATIYAVFDPADWDSDGKLEWMIEAKAASEAA